MTRGRKKGGVKTGGRQPGSPNKAVLPDVAGILAKREINPVNELIDLYKSGELKAHQKASIMQDLLQYVAEKRKQDDKQAEPEAINPADDTPDDVLTQSLRAAYLTNGNHAATG